MRDLFIRFVGCEAQAQRDMARGYSYIQYLVFPTEEAARTSDFVEYDGVDADTVAVMHDMMTGEAIGFGFAQSGLCGFQLHVDTLEEAVEEARERGGYNDVKWPFAAVYEGEYISPDDQGDDLFRPTELLSVVEL